MKIEFRTNPKFFSSNFGSVRFLLLGKINTFSSDVIITNKSQSTPWGGSSKRATSSSFQTVLNAIIVASMIASSVWWGPKIYYSFFTSDIASVMAQTEGTPLGGDFNSKNTGVEKIQEKEEIVATAYIPPQDPNLPEGDWVVIPRIGVRSQLQATQDADEALATGIWRAPDYGKPGDREMPMIVAGHRYGWDSWWKTDYWKYHSFNLLPTLEPGDTVEVISDQRKWVYEIYAGEEGNEITDYSADGIFYTCKHIDSPVRHFRYARLIDPTKDTQQIEETNKATDVELDKNAGQSGNITSK